MKKPHSCTIINCFVSTPRCVLRCAVRGACSVVVLVTSCAALLAATPAVWAPQQHKDSLRIYKGLQDQNNDFPYVVALLRESYIRICTGTLIAPTWVLGTAHCNKATHVQYGDMTVPRANITDVSAIVKYIKHPNYVEYNYFPTELRYYNDIGMVLVDHIPEEYGQLSALDYGTLLGLQVKYVGVGVSNMTYKNTADNREPRQLGYGVVASCTGVARALFYKPKICVASKCTEPQSAMPGDSGGPLLLEKKIIGITVGILYEPRITIFTPVSPYISWIRGIMDQYETVKK